MEDIRKIPTVQLIHILCETQDQGLINIIAYELACRVYVPDNKVKTFEELLTDFGYKKKEKPVKKLIK